MRRLICWTGLALMVLAAASTPALAGGGGGCEMPPPQPGAGWVTVADYCFWPASVQVSTGDAVRWQMQGQAPHTVTFDDGSLDSGELQGDTFAVRFNQPGTFSYFCSIHPGMRGEVAVSGAALGGNPMEIVDGTTVAPAGATTVLDDAIPTRIELSPLTAIAVIAVFFPLSLAAAMRLVDARPRSRMRLRLPWEAVSKDDGRTTRRR
jgi:plastocyanin